MRRASVSRRSDVFGSSGASLPRSRSQERSIQALDVDDTFGLNDNFTTTATTFDSASDHNNNDQKGDMLDKKEGSERLSSGRAFRRAMSDPFDVADGDLEDEKSHHYNKIDTHVHHPTLPRFPVSETRDKNCWSEPPISLFHVRGAGYLCDKKKCPSESFLLQARGADLFLSDNPLSASDIGPESVLGGSLRKVPTLLINFRFPWGTLVQYFELPKKFTPFLSCPGEASLANLTPAELCFAEWLMGDTNYRNDRLKLIPYVSDGPWVVRNMVTGKPAIIGRKLPVSYRYVPASADGRAEYLECDFDIGNSSSTAKRIVSVCRRYMSALTVDIGYVIEGKAKEHLPEQMLGAIRIHGADPIKAPKLGSDVA